jgi:transposase
LLLVGDKGYSYPTVRRLLARCGITAVCPRRTNQRPRDHRYRLFDRAVYRERNRVERLINQLERHRRVATRCEKRAAHYHAMLVVASILIWL